MKDLTSIINEFQDWALFDGKYSVSTIKRDSRKIRELSNSFNILAPTQEEVREYFIAKLKDGAKRQSLNVTRKAIVKWVRFLNEKQGAAIDIVLPKIKEPRTAIGWIPSDIEVRKIIHQADTQRNRECAARDGAIMRILFSGGLRIGEVARMDLNDIKENGIFVHSEKGEAETIVGLSDDAMNAIRKYIQFYRRPTDPKALFTSEAGRMDAEYMRQHISRIGKFVCKDFHPHAARHWIATTLLSGREEEGIAPIDIRFVQTHLRHASLASTQVYTHVDPEMNAKRVRERLNKFFLIIPLKSGPNEPEPVEAGPEGSALFCSIIEPSFKNAAEVQLCLA